MSDRPPSWHRIWQIPVEIVVALFLLLDSLVAPLFRPAMRWLSRLHLIHHLERAIASLPPYVILVLLIVPFAVAELAKVYAVLMMAEDRVRLGLTIFIAAYVVSILVCERIFSAGRGQLMTIGWFAVLFGWVMAIKDRVLTWCRATPAWQAIQRLRLRVGQLRQQVRDAFRRPKPGLAARRKS